MFFFYTISSLLFLYLTNSQMTRELSRLVHRLGGSQNILVWVWSLVFLPGTVIHELSHFLAATATGTKTGKIEILPEYLEDSIGGNRHVALGYVQVASMNPIQGFIVGIAPLITGILLLVWLAPMIIAHYYGGDTLLFALKTYLFFTVANSLFPSWSDIKQTIPLIIITVIFLAIAWLLDFSFFVGSAPRFQNILISISQALIFSALLNLVIIGMFFLINRKIRR